MQVTTIIDDLDKKPGAETIAFSLDGENWEIDLRAKNSAELRAIFQQYIPYARRSARPAPSAPRPDRGGRRNGHHPAPKAMRAASNAEIRSWAQARDLPVKDRGRIADEIADQYHAAHEQEGTPR